MIRLGLDEIDSVRSQLMPLIAMTDETDLPVIETAAACAMLHSFYTEIEKFFKIVAVARNGNIPSSESWHRDLLAQMSTATGNRPAVISEDLVPLLGELLAFRHLFRGASIALMRWNKLEPLVEKVDGIHKDVRRELVRFQEFLQPRGNP